MQTSAYLRLSIVLVALSVFGMVDAIRFDISANKQKCLGEFMSKHDLGKGSFTVLGIQEGAPSGVNVKITGPGDQQEFSQNNAASGKFGFTASEGGNHKVCFTNTELSSQRTVEFTWITGADAANDYADVAKKEHLKPLELALRKIEDRVENVHKEMMYQREREERHRDTNESTNTRVAWFSLLTIGIVLTQAAVQVQTLYTYFQRKKVINPR